MARSHVIALAAASLLLMGQTPPSPAPAGATVSGIVRVFDKGKPVDSPQDVWVYLQDQHPTRRAKPIGDGVRAEISQVRRQFSRPSLVIPQGATVWFPNLDREEHNVFSPSNGDQAFDLGRYNTDKTGKSRAFLDVGVLDIYCDIHREMNAAINVVDAPQKWIVQVTDGHYAIPDVPVGDYKVVAWLPHGALVKMDVAVVDGSPVTAGELHLHAGAPPASHTKIDGSQYGPYSPTP